MAFGKAGHADSETAWIWMGPGLIKSPDKPYQIDRVLECIARFVIRKIFRAIAAEGEDVSDLGLGIPMQNILDFRFIVANTGQMRDRIQLCRVLNSFHQIVR